MTAEVDPIIRYEGLVHIYKGSGLEVVASQGLDLHVETVGRAGSGKTTLMNVLVGIDVPGAGTAEAPGWGLIAAR